MLFIKFDVAMTTEGFVVIQSSPCQIQILIKYTCTHIYIVKNKNVLNPHILSPINTQGLDTFDTHTNIQKYISYL